LFIWATWKIRLIRIPMVTANLLMLVATPITGGRYVVDPAAGAVVMLAAVTITERLYAWMLGIRRTAIWQSDTVLDVPAN
jgi:hypothetical protein